MPEELKDSEISAELLRLQAKQSAIDDEDIRLAIQARIDSLEIQLRRGDRVEPAKQAQEEEEQIGETTPEQERQADQLIRQAKVEKMRKNQARALALMKEAAAAAPASSTVLEALADDLLDRCQYKEAASTYKRALRVDPKNIGIERKHAMATLRHSGMGLTLDQQLRASLSDSPFIAGNDNVASLTTARFLNALAPGVGHMVLGRSGTGLTILILYLLFVGWAVFMKTDISGMIQMMGGKNTHPNLVVLIPLFFAVVIWMATQASLGSGAKANARVSVARPVPPSEGINLPFE